MLSFLTLLLAASTCVHEVVAQYGPIPQETGCDVSRVKIKLPANQTQLVAPAEGPSFIGLAIGVQNYTCTAATSTWTNVGAVAELFDVSCLAASGLSDFSDLTQSVFQSWQAVPPTVTILEIIDTLAPFHLQGFLGQHFFVPSPSGTGLSPEWNFASASLAGHPNAFVIGAKVGDIPSPNGPPAIDWLMLNNATATGVLARQIFRINTVNGDAPASCTPGEADISVKYSSTYWFYGSAFH
ncbi:hypothetical protein FB45DRAFT_790570 [Roridomyces roridus]|uniref:Malate dehydrogenase n=1 Tax=Roridomyces roridus TaxID=1738132 RepID=A0AAD7FSJ1_9AGAR|nr:hypothetical protein FB45DRAFT_790570 [Roridomyces roridus]